MVDYGVDLQWTDNEVLSTVKGNDNVIQHIKNRLQTGYDELNWIYECYGCNYKHYIGSKTNDEALEFVKNSIRQSLNEDKLIDTFDLDLSYLGDGVINIILKVEEEVFDFNIGDEE